MMKLSRVHGNMDPKTTTTSTSGVTRCDTDVISLFLVPVYNTVEVNKTTTTYYN